VATRCPWASAAVGNATFDCLHAEGRTLREGREVREDVQSSISHTGGQLRAGLKKVNSGNLGGENAGEHLDAPAGRHGGGLRKLGWNQPRQPHSRRTRRRQHGADCGHRRGDGRVTGRRAR